MYTSTSFHDLVLMQTDELSGGENHRLQNDYNNNYAHHVFNHRIHKEYVLVSSKRKQHPKKSQSCA